MEIVELRVHGVHGTSPGAMLGVSDGEAGQVAGDRLTGIYRVKNAKVPYRDLEHSNVSVEAYSWGALTSGVQGFLGWVKRALWLLLLPFALANLAYWARLHVGQRTGQARWGARAVRTSSLLLTVFMVLTPCVIAIDLVGWQCYQYGVRGCTHLPGQLNGVAGWTPTQRIALGTLFPMLLIGLLWLLSRQTLLRYEVTPARPPGEAPGLGRKPILRDPDLWQGNARTLRLQRLHLATAVATVTGFSGRHLLSVTTDGRAWILATTIVSAVVMVLAVFLVCLNHPTDLENREPRAEPGPGPVGAAIHWAESVGWAAGEWMREHLPSSGWLTIAALVNYGVHVLALWLYGGEVDESGEFYGQNFWFIVVFVLLTALHLTVFAGGRMHPAIAVTLVLSVCGAAFAAERLWRNGEFKDGTLAVAVTVVLAFCIFLAVWQTVYAGNADKAWRGAGASVLMAAAAWISLLFTSSAVIASADYLNGPDHSVGDLATVLPESSPPDGVRYLATGDIVLHHANVVVDNGGVNVFRGTVTVDGLSYKLIQPGTENVLSEAIGSSPVSRVATLDVPAGDIAFEDSCILSLPLTDRAPWLSYPDWLDDPCTAEGPEFHPGGVIQVTDQNLLLLPHDDAIVLENTHTPQAPLVVPQVLVWAPIGQLVWLAAVILALIVCVPLYLRTAGRRIARFLYSDTVGPPDDEVPARDRANCSKKRRTAGLAHRAETLLGVIGSITAPVALLIIVYAFTGQAPWERAEWTRRYATLSMYVVIAMSAALVALGSQIRRSEGARKAVGVIWDLTTFWPRAAHPLAPPCYAERVVPELETRTHWALHQQNGLGHQENRVVLSGHSQGSLIVAAMASRLSNDDLRRVRMVTYGSQIRALYGRVFPRIFGPDDIGYEETTGAASLVDAFPDLPRKAGTVPGPPPVMGDDSLRGRLEAAGGGWVNLFRRSDPLGYRVFSDLDSDLDVPVPEVPGKPLGDPGPLVMTHSGYQHSLAYRKAVASWTNEVVVPDPTSTRDLPTLPPL